MTAQEFLDFRQSMAVQMGLGHAALSERKTAALMGCSRGVVRTWSTKGTPLYVAYACNAIHRGLTPWGYKQPRKDAA